MTRSRTALGDVEVVGLLLDRPELLAIADAVAATQRLPRRRRRLLARFLSAAAVVALAAGALLAAPWPQREGGFVQRALAAMGPLPVVHVVLESEDPYSSLVDLQTGARTPTLVRIEYWFDRERGQLRSVQLRNGVFSGEMLEGAGGGRSSSGPVRALPGMRPRLNPALAGFVRGYRQALAEGTASLLGEGNIDGKRVMWVSFRTANGSERAAVDTETLRPLLVRSAGRSGEESPYTWRVRLIETIQRRASDFREPARLSLAPYRGDVRASEPISSAQAAELPWRVVWLGESWRGLRLVRLERHALTRSYLPGQKPRLERGDGVRLVYRIDGRDSAVDLSESPRPETAYGFASGSRTFSGNPLPPEGAAEIVSLRSAGGAGACIAQLQVGRVWVTIRTASREICIDSARSLTGIGDRKDGS